MPQTREVSKVVVVVVVVVVTVVVVGGVGGEREEEVSLHTRTNIKFCSIHTYIQGDGHGDG